MHLLEPSQINFTSTLLEGKVTTLYVTSTHFGNGTSTVAYSLAKSLLDLVTDSVLLIDANIRTPDITRHFKLTNQPGLTDLCYQETPAKLSDCIYNPDAKQLQVMPSGSHQQRHLKDIEKEHFQSVLKQLRNKYGFIIVDAPPLFDRQETLAMVSCFDGVALVIDTNSTRQEVALAGLDLIRQAGGKPIGTIFNRRRYHIPQRLYQWL